MSSDITRQVEITTAEVEGIGATATEEFWQATDNFLLNTWGVVTDQFSFWNLLNPFDTISEIWKGWASTLLNYFDDLTDIPLRTLTRVGAATIPIPKRLNNTVIRAGDAYQFAATAIVESLLDYIGGHPLPVSWRAYKKGEQVLNVWEALRFNRLTPALNLLKGQLIGRILTIGRMTLNLAMAITAVLIILRLIARANSFAFDSDLPTLSQDSERTHAKHKHTQRRQNRRAGPDRS